MLQRAVGADVHSFANNVIQYSLLVLRQVHIFRYVADGVRDLVLICYWIQKQQSDIWRQSRAT